MKSVVSLRLASALTLLHAVLHTVGGVFGKPAPGIGAATVALMQANRFDFLGTTRSYWDFYRGMGLAVSILLTAEGLAFWMLGTLARRDAARLRPMLAVFLVAYLLLALSSSIYFFSAPVVVEILIAACMGSAIVSAKPVAAV